MFLLATAALAGTVSVPIRATYTEYTGWGEDPTVVDEVLSATVSVTNPATGVKFPTKGELLLKERTGAGAGELQFDADPSNSTRTWAVWALDADGVPIVAEPDIVDIAFGEDGDGSIYARRKPGWILVNGEVVILPITIKKRNVARVSPDDGTHDITVEVADLGIRAAYVGIQELSTDGPPLAAHVDLEAMTAEVYAEYQAQALDVIVPLDTWKATVDGTVSVEGLDMSGKHAEGGATLEFGLSFFGKPTDGSGKEAPGFLDDAVYALDRVRRLADNCTGRVMLKANDRIFDVYDAAVNVIVEGDARGWEVAGVLDPADGAPPPVTPVLVSLDPSDVAVGASASFDAPFPAKPEAEGVRTLGIQPLGEDGKPLDTWLECTLTPTAPSATAGSTALNYVGECLRDDEGRAYVRGLRMTLSADGTGSLSAELLGLQWQKATALAFDLDGDDLGVGTVDGPASVTATSFSLDWTFNEDPLGHAYGVELTFWGAAASPTFELVGDGTYRWPHEKGWTSTLGVDEDGTVYAKDKISKEDAAALTKALVDAGAEVELK